MKASRSHDAPYEEQQAARSAARALVADYLNDALVVLQYQSENLLGHDAVEIKKHDPLLLAGLIVTQSIDRGVEVLAREIGLAAKRVSDAVESLQVVIAEANQEQQAQNIEVLCFLESMDTVITEFVGRNKP